MSADSPNQVLEWMCKDFVTTEYWKAEARRFYLGTVIHPSGDADSDKAREVFAKHIKVIFSQFAPQDTTIEQWSKGNANIVSVDVPAPQVSENVDWDWIADYFLLAAGVPWREYEELNTSREEFNNKLQSRLDFNIDRLKKYHERMQESKDSLFGNTKDKGRPVLVDEEKGKAISLSGISLYKTKYF